MTAAAQNVLVGTYTQKLPHADGKGRGLLGSVFTDGVLAPPGLLERLVNPSFVTLNAATDRAYVVGEVKQNDGGPGGTVTALARHLETGRLSVVNQVPSLGGQPCHLEIDPRGRFVVVANYETGSVVVFEINPTDGGIGEITDTVQHEGSGPDESRQEGPHPHMAAFIPGTSDLIVPDLGNDQVFVYALTNDGKLEERRAMRYGTAPGAGPRHVAFHSDGRHLFLLNELDSTLTLLRFEDARLEAVETVSTLADGFAGESTAGAVQVSASGRFVFASNRGADSNTIAMFRFDPSAESVTLALTVPSGGQVPRDIKLDPSGRYLLVANQDSDLVTTFAIDESAPALRFVAEASVPTPVCIRFV